MGVWARADSACAENALAFAAMNPPIPSPIVARIARGGKPIHGAPLGIIMLETRFPRIPGDIGNALTWPFPVLYRVVPGATPERVVLQGAAGLLPDFIAAAQELVAMGAEAITTSCGFLCIFQKEIAAAVGVPVATSALLQVPWVEALLPPGRRVGVITASRPSLTPAHLAAAGMAPDTPVMGVEDGRELFRVLVRQDKAELDTAAAEQDMLEAGRALVARHPEIGAIVLECTNMPPYAAALQAALGLPVHDVVSLGGYLFAGLRPRRYD
jgi:Asp/Glu/hydantoin racemase